MHMQLRSRIPERGYAKPGVLISTEAVAARLQDPEIRLVEANEDPLLYPAGHLPGAVALDWVRDLNDPVRRDYLGRAEFERLMARLGATPTTTLVLYGDQHNWWATYAFWVLQLFGHTRAKILDGGQRKWLLEERPLATAVPAYPPTRYPAPPRDDGRIRAFRDQVLVHLARRQPLVDVRSPEEYRGERLHMPDYPNEGALRAGHIPGAANIPWGEAVHPEDGTFKAAAELRRIYQEEHQLRPEDEIVTYCRIGERSSHTWFVLTYLLGFPRVRNYDGSWTEWGNLVGVPIANPSARPRP